MANVPPGRTVLVVALLVVALSVGSGGVVAQSSDQQNCPTDLYGAAQAFTAVYNQNVDQLPDRVRNRVAGQTLSVVVTDGDTDHRFTAVTDDAGRITSLDRGEPEGPTLVVTTDRETLCRIVTSDDPGAAVMDAYDDGKITVSATSFVDSVVLETLEFVYHLLHGLGLF